MSPFWPLFAANLVMTAVMALVVALAGRWTPVRRHPRLRHALWLLVVAKLLTPPLFECPVLPSAAFKTSFETELGEPIASRTVAWGGTAEPQPHSALDGGAQLRGETGRTSASSAATMSAPLHSGVRPTGALPIGWLSFSLMAIVALPAALLLARCVRQTRRIARLIAQAASVDARLSRIAGDAARKMGVATPPEIRLVAGRLMPLLWVRSGRPTIVLPAPLVARLRDDQLECIICHELAHFIRRDHWSNAFALAVAAGYWWFPFVWWARRELLAAQEQCCDALVILAGGISRRLYAETLFETIEFINDERLLLPALASGFGKVSAVRRRFEMIAGQRLSPRFPIQSAAFALLIVGAFFSLPVRGQGAREAGREEPAAASADSAAPRAAPSGKAPAVPVPAVEKTELKYRTAELTVEAAKHCVLIGQQAAAGKGALRVDLERGVTYKVTATGEAFMSDQTGADADPFPGVVFYYSTDEEDGYAVRYAVLKPGDSLTFRTPWLISESDEVFALAFFLDAWPGSENHGRYTLTFQRGDEVTRPHASEALMYLYRSSIHAADSAPQVRGLKRAIESRPEKSSESP